MNEELMTSPSFVGIRSMDRRTWLIGARPCVADGFPSFTWLLYAVCDDFGNLVEVSK